MASVPDRPVTRFSRLFAWPSRIGLAALVLLIVTGFGRPLTPVSVMEMFAPSSAKPSKSDADLYRAIAERVASGESYYAAAVAEHRAQHYPLRPFVTVRLPTLAWIQAASGQIGARILLAGLFASAWWAFRRRCERDSEGTAVLPALSVLAAAGLAPLMDGTYTAWHEPWVGGLMLLSFALRAPGRWGTAAFLGLAAAAIRELAIPYLCAMACVAALEGHRREAAAWGAAILAAGLMLAAHAWMLAAYVTPYDPASQGWVSIGGWTFVMDMMNTCTLLTLAPAPVIAVVLPLCILGWMAWPGPIGARGALIVTGYLLAFLVIGRPENAYWGILIAPLLFPGLAFAPAALRDLLATALPSRRTAAAA